MAPDKDTQIYDMLLEGKTYREIATTLKVGNDKIKAIRDAYKEFLPEKPKKIVKTKRQPKSNSDNTSISKDLEEAWNNKLGKDFIDNFKDRRSRRTSIITQEEKEHLRKCLVAGNHIRSFSKEMMNKALKILDKL